MSNIFFAAVMSRDVFVSLKVGLVAYYFPWVTFDWNNKIHFCSKVPAQAIVILSNKTELWHEVAAVFASRIPGGCVSSYSCPPLFLFLYFRLFYQHLIKSEPVVRISLHGIWRCFYWNVLTLASTLLPPTVVRAFLGKMTELVSYCMIFPSCHSMCKEIFLF